MAFDVFCAADVTRNTSQNSLDLPDAQAMQSKRPTFSTEKAILPHLTDCSSPSQHECDTIVNDKPLDYSIAVLAHYFLSSNRFLP